MTIDFLKWNALWMLLVMFSGCMSLTQSEKNMVYELKSYGANTCDVKIKEPAVAAWLNLMPGVGHFYLASGSEDGQLWGMAFFNLFTYPLSWFWGIPGAYSDAGVLNQKELVRFYQFTPAGREQLNAFRKKYQTMDLGLGENSDGRIRAS